MFGVEVRVSEFSLSHPEFFRHVVRRELYRRYKDPEKVHEEALKMLGDYEEILYNHRRDFEFPDLEVNIKGKIVKPIGTSAGMDKNGDALSPLSLCFGFLEPGTVVVNKREGNKRPRVVGDEKHMDLYNAQGFPSKGLGYFFEQAKLYRKLHRTAPVYVSICGLPISEKNAVEVALQEMRILLTKLNPYVDGFVWNPFSPNTAALTVLRRPDVFTEHAKLVTEYAADKLRLVKMGPYEADKEDSWMELVDAWLKGGGDGIVAVNTYMIPKEKVPSNEWGYPSAGRSGRFLKPYRFRAVRAARENFPKAIIFATGGIYDGDDAYHTFRAGADAIEGYTPYTFYGLGLLRNIARGVEGNLRRDGYKSLEHLRSSIRSVH